MARRSEYGDLEWRNDSSQVHLYFGRRVAHHLLPSAKTSFKVRLSLGLEDDGSSTLVVELDRGQPGRLLTASHHRTNEDRIDRWTVCAKMTTLGIEAVHDCVRRKIDPVLVIGEHHNSVVVPLPESVREVGTQVPDREESPDLGNLVRHVRETADQHGLEAVTRAVLHELNTAARDRGKTLNADAGVVRLLDLPRGVTFEG